MTRCVVSKCSESGVHNFPKDQKIQKLWLKAIRRENLIPKRSTRICRKHFIESDYGQISKYTGIKHQHKYLNKDAIPSIFPWNTNTVSDEVNMIIYKVYKYLQSEYEYLKTLNMEGCDLSPLANIAKRTAEATDVSEQTVYSILYEHHSKESSKDERPATESEDVMIIGEDLRNKTLDNIGEPGNDGIPVTVKTEPMDYERYVNRRDRERDITVTVKAEPFDDITENVHQDGAEVPSCLTAEDYVVSTSNNLSDSQQAIEKATVTSMAIDPEFTKNTEPKRKKHKYTSAELNAAVKALDEGESINNVSAKFRIPKSTIRDHRSQKYISTYCEAQTVLKTDEEMRLVEWMKTLKELQFNLTKAVLFETVAKMLKDLKRPNPFKDGIPGPHWYHKFSNRYRSVLRLIPRTSALHLTHGVVRNWFSKISKYFNENDLVHVLNDPSRVFNCDEVSLSMNGNKQLVVRREYTKDLGEGIDMERLTVVLNICADGRLAPPMVVYSNGFVPTVPLGWGLSSSNSGWTDDVSLHDYIVKCLYPWLLENCIQFPIVVFLDGYTKLISPDLLKFCKGKRIFLIGLLTHAKHVLQPLDVAILGSLEESWGNIVRNYKMEKNHDLNRSVFASQVKICLDACVSAEAIKIGFKNSCLCPFRPDNINYWKFLRPSKAVVSESNKEDDDKNMSA